LSGAHPVGQKLKAKVSISPRNGSPPAAQGAALRLIAIPGQTSIGSSSAPRNRYRVALEVRLITNLRSFKHRKNRQRAIWKNNAEVHDKPLVDRVVGLDIVLE
jgi:hypothetical protein